MIDGDTIRKARLAARLSQRELANYLNVNQQYISQIERNIRPISFEMLQLISKFLKICPMNLIKCDLIMEHNFCKILNRICSYADN